MNYVYVMCMFWKKYKITFNTILYYTLSSSYIKMK